jgi:hypothetical protein
MNNFSRSLHYQITHQPPLFICSSPGPDPYCSNENVYEELEHQERSENQMMNHISSDAEILADTPSLPEENCHETAGDVFDLKNKFHFSISSHSTMNNHRNSNNKIRLSKFNTDKLLLNKNSLNRISQDSFKLKKMPSTGESSTSSCYDHDYKIKGYEGDVMMNDVNDDDTGSKKVNEFEKLIQIRKSFKHNVPNSASTAFSNFEMPYPPKVNSNFYVQSHDMMSNRRNRFKTMDLQERNIKSRDYFYNTAKDQNRNRRLSDHYNNNDEADIEIFQPREILSEFANFNNGQQPIYNNSAALSSDSGYSQNTNTLSEGTLDNPSKRNSNGNIFILSSILHNGNSQATDSMS